MSDLFIDNAAFYYSTDNEKLKTHLKAISNELQSKNSDLSVANRKIQELEKQLGVMTPLVRIKYGNLDSEVYEEILKSETLLQGKTNNE